MQYVDLSVVMNEQTPVFPGDAPTKFEPANRLERDGCSDHYVSMNNHAGTHIDAPLHVIKDGKRLDEIPLEQFIGRGRLVTVGESGFSVAALERAGVEPGDIVLFHTGMSERFYEPSYFQDYPAMSEEVARYLVERGVKMVGLDTGGADNDGLHIHQILLDGGVLIIENLTNLKALQDKEFTVYALPVKWQLDGAPARVIAAVA